MFKQKISLVLALLLLVFAFFEQPTNASGGEYKKVVQHLKTKYQAKKVKIPMVWLARFGVRMIRPAGVKSFSVTTFENLKLSRSTLDAEMQSALKESFSPEWSPVFRVRSRNGQQAYMYLREAGSSIKVFVVTIDQNKAAVIRAAFNPDKLANFINDPKIFGISLDDNEQRTSSKTSDAKDAAPFENKPKETKEND